ncbi:MAG: ATP-binding protein [Vicinamibacterales bacterium]
MRILGSLQNRIFLASALLAALSIGGALYFVSTQITSAIEAELQRDLGEAASLVDQQRATLFETFTLMARLVADLPKFKAAVGTRDAPTVQPIALEYQQQIGSDVFIVADNDGHVLASVGGSDDLRAGLEHKLRGRHRSSDLVAGIAPHPRGLLQLINVPISIGLASPERLGTLTVGYLLDDDRAARFKALTGADIAFALGSDVRASTLGVESFETLAPLVRRSQVSRVTIGASEYELLMKPLLSPSGETSTENDGAAALVLKSRTERIATLSTIQTALIVLAFATMLLAVAVSYAVARTITRPLATITDHMRQVAMTGDLTRKLALENRRGWDDDDAQVLATTFNTLTDSIARFQREANQRERLSSLGRMSTVLAHEIRNPLMIIKGALRQITRDHAASADVREAATDIDEEIERLNRLVNDVLDVARPIRFERAATDLNAVCRAAAAAATAGEPEPAIGLTLDPHIPIVESDGEHLRTALVNLLGNARQAVRARGADGKDEPLTRGAERAPVTLLTSRLGDRRVAIIVSDHGTGIAPDDLARIFDPYFTTRRAGTGLGLPIAKNIVEGLGGSIGVSSQLAVGTQVRIEIGDAPAPCN